MKVANIHFSSLTCDWSTPQGFFDILNDEFHFTLDVCATAENAKCDHFFTPDDNGLFQKWEGICWLNPITCWIHPNVLSLLYEKKNLHNLQRKISLDVEILPSQVDIERWVALCLQRMQPKKRSEKPSKKTGKPITTNKIAPTKKEICNIKERLIDEAKIQSNIQSLQKATKFIFEMGLDCRGLGKLQENLESYLCILRYLASRVNSGSFYPFIFKELSGDNKREYDTSLHELQYQETTLKSRRVVQKQEKTCSDCGLSTCISLGAAWCNPPYSRDIGRWIGKAVDAARNGATVACLLPARTDTKWFHGYCTLSNDIRFIRGRLHFTSGSKTGCAPFPSMIVVFSPDSLSSEIEYRRMTTESLETTHKRVSDQAISDALPFGPYRTLPGHHFDSLGSLFPAHPKRSGIFGAKQGAGVQ